jgi:hypothetical protein
MVQNPSLDVTYDYICGLVESDVFGEDFLAAFIAEDDFPHDL